MRVHNPNDRYCLARAVIIGLARIRMVDHGDGNGVHRFKEFCQQQHQHLFQVENLMRNAGLEFGLMVILIFLNSLKV